MLTVPEMLACLRGRRPTYPQRIKAQICGAVVFRSAKHPDVEIREQVTADTPQWVVDELLSRDGAVFLPDVTTSDPCRAPLAALLEQVQQMRGLFPDDDGAISRAIRDAELVLFGETDEPMPEDTA